MISSQVEDCQGPDTQLLAGEDGPLESVIQVDGKDTNKGLCIPEVSDCSLFPEPQVAPYTGKAQVVKNP